MATPERARFEDELEQLLNRYNQEASSGTPDFILAVYLMDCLRAFNLAVRTREQWHGRAPGGAPANAPEQEA
jgi:hypothetical protein